MGKNKGLNMGFADWFKRKEVKLRKAYSIISTQDYGTAKWSDRNYENFAKEAYITNVIAYRCIYEIAKGGVQVEWYIYREKNGKKERVTDTAYSHLLKRPNHDDSFGFLMMKLISFFKISGNSYSRQIRRQTGDKVPLQLYIMRPDKMTVACDDKGMIKSYIYCKDQPEEMIFPVDVLTGESDILQMKEFHPTDDFYGLSSIEPGSYMIDTNNEATKWNFNLLRNDARIGMIYTFNGILDEEDYDQVEQNIKKFSGSSGAGQSLILHSEGGVDAKPYMLNPKDLDFIEGWRQTARATCNAFGYPSQLMGIPGDATYSNMLQARQSLWEETIMFILNLIKEEYNNWLFKTNKEGLGLDYSTENVAALSEKRTMLWKRAEEASFLTIDEKREMVGKDPLPGGIGNVLLIPANLIPLGEELPEEPNKPGEEIGIEDDDDKARELMGIPSLENT